MIVKISNYQDINLLLVSRAEYLTLTVTKLDSIIELPYTAGLFLILSRKNNNNFATYLAGLIEGDGSIIVPSYNVKSYNSFFEIVFHIKDIVLAQTLQSILDGNIKIKPNYCVLYIKIFSFKGYTFIKWKYENS